MSLLTKASKAIGTSLFAATLSFSTAVSAAPMPGVVIDNGELVGLTNINVVGYGLYDVTFSSQFQNIYYEQNFVFSAGAAGMALIGENGPWDDTFFDLNPEKTRGCSGAISVCDWVVAVGPFSQGLIMAGVLKNYGGNDDAQDTAFPTIASSLGSPSTTYLDWTRSQVGQVPVPAAAFMFAPALLGLLGLRRKAKS